MLVFLFLSSRRIHRQGELGEIRRFLIESAQRSILGYLADTGHSGHSELCVTVQLQSSLAEEEVDLVVVALFIAAALPH